MNATFSIITISKDALPELQRTYESLKSQTLKDFEWVVIDGASNDGTREWLCSIRDNEFEFSWESEGDEGIADAWNKGIVKSKGSQILILNAGDTYDSNMIEAYKKKISRDKITCSHARLIDPNSLLEVGIFRPEPEKLWRGMHLPHNWCSVPKDFYEIHGKYPLLKYAMDFAWFHKFYKANGKSRFECMDLVLGSYYLGGVSDKNYIKSFGLNKKILIDNGSSKFLALFISTTYIIKHFLSNLKKYLKK